MMACEPVHDDFDSDDPAGAAPIDSEFFGAERCPASETPALHAPIWTDAVSGHCARCKMGFFA
jgi:hypothetical protein